MKYALLIVFIALSAVFFWLGKTSAPVHQAALANIEIPDSPFKKTESVAGTVEQPELLAKDRLPTRKAISNPKDLSINWDSEYGCFIADDDAAMLCDYTMLTASSYEEAQWMRDNGYPARTELDKYLGHSYIELKSLAKQGDNLAMILFGIRLAERGRYASARSWFYSSLSEGMNAYNLRMFAHALKHEASSENPGNALDDAAIYFKMAALLGDREAHYEFIAFISEFWQPTTPTVSRITDHANLVTSRYFNAPRDDWPVTPRPGG